MFLFHFVMIRKLVDNRNERKSWCHEPMKYVYNLQTYARLFYPPLQFRYTSVFQTWKPLRCVELQLAEFPGGMLAREFWKSKRLKVRYSNAKKADLLDFLPVCPSICPFTLLILLNPYLSFSDWMVSFSVYIYI